MGYAAITSAIAAFRANRARYPRTPWPTEPSLWAVAVYRLGAMTLEPDLPLRPAFIAIYAILSPLIRLLTLIELPRSATIGPGLRIHHLGPVIVNNRTIIGSGCTLRPGVVLGHAGDEESAPRIGDDVSFGVHSMAIGSITIGNSVTIGAMTLVRTDIPDGARCAGIPARVLQ